jgi:hypothetical protein
VCKEGREKQTTSLLNYSSTKEKSLRRRTAVRSRLERKQKSNHYRT